MCPEKKQRPKRFCNIFYKTRAILDEMKERLRTEWAKLDHVVIAAAVRQWRRR